MDGKRVWSKEDTFALINMFEGFTELWQIKSKMYRDRLKKFDATEAEIQRKLHNLRTQENQEWNKMKKRKSGQGTDDTYNSSWEYFESLKFLVDQNMASGTEDNLLTLLTTADNKYIKKKRTCNDNAMEKAMAVLNRPSDEFDIFGEYVASELRSLQHDHNRRKLKRMIQKAILDMSEIDDNARSSSVQSTYSQASVYSNDSQTSIHSVYSPPPAVQPIQSAPQTSYLPPISHSSCVNSSSTPYYQELEPRSTPHSIQGLSLKSYIQGFETDT
ncbi:hypothetical protein NQ317_017222 [Molorchus minor]|uniref:MADF domain-containing protein n=1 Tax=Molorchus minor TaxID=1323400 RepID=A0ABQ9JHP4_9CUCU|nr:hypothetical protein NQ317_017222 [Molorchus minor]